MTDNNAVLVKAAKDFLDNHKDSPTAEGRQRATWTFLAAALPTLAPGKAHKFAQLVDAAGQVD
ncbi:MAG: hypothetical protein OXC26_01770 [Albidovulum sp.]|nr:hypothetical protein [Albidovulum sp.]